MRKEEKKLSIKLIFNLANKVQFGEEMISIATKINVRRHHKVIPADIFGCAPGSAEPDILGKILDQDKFRMLTSRGKCGSIIKTMGNACFFVMFM